MTTIRTETPELEKRWAEAESGVAVRSSDLLARIVALSGGKDSTAMALRLAECEPNDYEYVITPTGNELPEMFAHWRRLGELLGKPLKPIGRWSLEGLIMKYQTLPNWRMRFCTREIKIEPFQRYALQRAPAVCYVGIRADEADAREGTYHTGITGVTQDCPLVRWGWDINDVKNYLRKRGVEVPERTDCAACFFQTIAEWWRLWKLHPDEYEKAEGWEEMTGHTLRSAQRDTWPAGLKELRLKFEAGYTPKGAAQLTFRLDVAERPTMCAWCAR